MHSCIVLPPSARTQYSLTGGNPNHPLYVATLRELGPVPLDAITHSLIQETVARLAPSFLSRRIRQYRYRALCRKVYTYAHSEHWTPPRAVSPLMAEHYRERRERASWYRSQRAAWRYERIASYLADGHSNADAVRRRTLQRVTRYRASCSPRGGVTTIYVREAPR